MGTLCHTGEDERERERELPSTSLSFPTYVHVLSKVQCVREEKRTKEKTVFPLVHPRAPPITSVVPRASNGEEGVSSSCILSPNRGKCRTSVVPRVHLDLSPLNNLLPTRDERDLFSPAKSLERERLFGLHPSDRSEAPSNFPLIYSTWNVQEVRRLDLYGNGRKSGGIARIFRLRKDDVSRSRGRRRLLPGWQQQQQRQRRRRYQRQQRQQGP